MVSTRLDIWHSANHLINLNISYIIFSFESQTLNCHWILMNHTWVNIMNNQMNHSEWNIIEPKWIIKNKNTIEQQWSKSDYISESLREPDGQDYITTPKLNHGYLIISNNWNES